MSLTFDKSGNLYFGDGGFPLRVRKVSDGIISTVAGGGSSTGDGVAATSAALDAVESLTVDGF